MKTYHKNPRQITRKQMENLKDTLSELGDLSGIVHDLTSDEIVGGNQRGRALDVNTCEIELTHESDVPDEQGTVALGFIVWKGKRFSYRQVLWTPAQCEKANIVANKAGGYWDFDILANEFDMPDLLDWGFEACEFHVDGDKGDGLDFSPKTFGDAENHIIYITFKTGETAGEVLEALTYGSRTSDTEDSTLKRIAGEMYSDRWLEALHESD